MSSQFEGINIFLHAKSALVCVTKILSNWKL